MIKVEEVNPRIYYRIWLQTERKGDMLIGELSLDDNSDCFIVTNHRINPYKPIHTRYPATPILNENEALKVFDLSSDTPTHV